MLQWSTSWKTCCASRAGTTDPKNHDEVAQIASKITKAPPERFGWLFTKQDTYRDPNLIPNLEALQRNVDTTHELGFVKKKIDIKHYSTSA